MKPSLKITGPSDIPMLDLRDSLLLRLGALDLIRGCIVRCIENFEVGDRLLSASYLLDIVITDCAGRKFQTLFRKEKYHEKDHRWNEVRYGNINENCQLFKRVELQRFLSP